MYYHCKINKVQGTALADTGAMRTYISRKYAEKANLQFKQKADSRCRISLPNGQVLGQCEFELKLSELSEMVLATVLELDTDFDIVLGLSWHRQWKPLPDCDTLDMFVNTPQGVLRIAHKMGAIDAVVHRLTVIEDLPEELRSSHILLKEAEKVLKGGTKAYLYFIREHTGILMRILPSEGILTRILVLV